MKTNRIYTTRLQAGLGLISETKQLLSLWTEGMSTSELTKYALGLGVFSNISSRRLKNIVVEGFAPRYLVKDDYPAKFLKQLSSSLSTRAFSQILFIFTCRANPILFDFVCEMYWTAYAAGSEILTNEQARNWIQRAIENGRTTKPWSESTVIRVARYLTGACADFGLLEDVSKDNRRIIPFRVLDEVAVFLAYDLHFSGLGDNSVLSHPDWGLFGLTRDDVLAELKRLALQDWFIVQSGGGAVRIGWQYNSMEEVVDVLARG
ncbi:DUF1819 family protein [Candidatus Parcubacteria bacterium]|nr:MAG: DUF1819 family protein [Candidatus Parcubacteria bacterium]